MSMRAIAIKPMDGCHLRGVLHLPSQSDCFHGQAAILLPGMIGTRVGPHRILLDLAERLSIRGLPTLRCDPMGSGYSDGPPATLEESVQNVRDMIHFMENELGAETIVLGGICRGAKVALASSLHEPRVTHLLLLACPRLREESIERKVNRRRWHHLRRYLEKALALKWIPRLLRGDLNYRLIAKAIWNPVDRASLARNDTGKAASLERLRARALFVYGGCDPDLDDHQAYYQAVFADRPHMATFRTIDEADQAFYAVRWHRAALESVEAWLQDEVL